LVLWTGSAGILKCARLTFYPIGNADTCLIDLANGKKVLFDFADMCSASWAGVEVGTGLLFWAWTAFSKQPTARNVAARDARMRRIMLWSLLETAGRESTKEDAARR
jgi:hypothetical protein